MKYMDINKSSMNIVFRCSILCSFCMNILLLFYQSTFGVKTGGLRLSFHYEVVFFSLSRSRSVSARSHTHTYARTHYAHTRIPVFNAPSLHDVTEVTDMIQTEFFNELFLHHKGTCTAHENRRPLSFNYWHRERL